MAEVMTIVACAAVDAAHGSTRYTDAFIKGTKPEDHAPKVASSAPTGPPVKAPSSMRADPQVLRTTTTGVASTGPTRTAAHPATEPRYRTIGQMLESFGLTPDDITIDALALFTMTALAETCGTEASPLDAVLRLMNTDAQASTDGPSTTSLLRSYGASGLASGNTMAVTPDPGLSAEIQLPLVEASAAPGRCTLNLTTNAHPPDTPPPPPDTPPPPSPDTPPPPAYPPPPGHVSANIPPPPTTHHGADGSFNFNFQGGN